MTWGQALLGLTAGFLIASVTAPVGISGAVFLLPVQLSLLQVPSPAVTPTNLLYNVVAGPGALARYRHQGQLTGPLAGQLLTGTVPGVILGAVIRVYFAAGPRLFRLLAAAVLLPLGIWLCTRPPGAAHPSRPHPTAPVGWFADPAPSPCWRCWSGSSGVSMASVAARSWGRCWSPAASRWPPSPRPRWPQPL